MPEMRPCGSLHAQLAAGMKPLTRLATGFRTRLERAAQLPTCRRCGDDLEFGEVSRCYDCDAVELWHRQDMVHDTGVTIILQRAS